MKNFFEVLTHDFFITGSYAVHLYTGKRQYDDIDIAVKEEDLPKVAKELGVECVRSVSTFNKEYAHVKFENYDFGAFIIQDGKRDIDFGIKGCYQRTRKIQIEGKSIRVISPEDLVLVKLMLAREDSIKRDLSDVRLMLEEVDLDLGYLVQKAYGLNLIERLLQVTEKYQIDQIKEILFAQSHFRFYFFKSNQNKLAYL